MEHEYPRFTILAHTDHGLDEVLKAFLQPYPSLQGITAQVVRDCFEKRQEGSQSLMDLDPERKYIVLTMNMDASWAVIGLRMIITPGEQPHLSDYLIITPNWWFPNQCNRPAWRIAWQANNTENGLGSFLADAPAIEWPYEPFEHYAVLTDYGFDSL